jgi:hypothetical protein
MDTVNILVEAKKQYTDELQKILTPRLYEGFKALYEDIIDILIRELSEKNTQGSSIIKTFQKTLKEIPQWNQDMIKNEYNRIEKLSNCDYFDNLIEAVFIANTKILTSVQINDNKSQNIKISVPQPPHFIHRCYIECAKEIYKNPYIFDNSKNLTPKEKHNNLREAISIIDLSINNAIRNLLPIRDILKHGLTKNYEKNIEENNNQKVDISEEEDDDDLNEEEDDDSNEIDKNQEENLNNEEVLNEIDTNQEEEEVLNEIDTNQAEKEEVLNEIDAKEKEVLNEIDTNQVEEEEVLNEIDANQAKEEILNQINLNEEEEVKEIFYKKVEKNNNIKNVEKEELNENNITVESVMEEIKKEKNLKSQNKHFLKKINSSKFIKNKHGGEKNNSFYARKYNENSANYNSILNEKTINTTNLTKIEDFKIIEAPKIIKNKIMLNGLSSDVDESDDEIIL